MAIKPIRIKNGLYIPRLGKNLEDATATENHDVLMAHFDHHSPDYNPDEATAGASYQVASYFAAQLDSMKEGNSKGGQRDRAKDLEKLIDEIVRVDRSITAHRLKIKLKQLAAEDSSIVTQYDAANSVYYWKDQLGKIHKQSVSGIADHLTKARKRLAQQK